MADPRHVGEQKHLKAQGVRYARSLQIAVRTAGMLSVDHTVAAGPIQQSFDLLNELLKQQREFTVGFVDNRVMLNTILTADAGLKQLENEFLKRGISAVRFEIGLTMARYKQVVSILSTPTAKIEQAGGLLSFLAANPVSGVRIFPAGKNQKRTESGDTVLEMDTEAFLLARDASEAQTAVSSEALSLLFDSACLDKPERIGGPAEIMRLVGPTIEAALVGERGDPQKAYVALAQVLQGLRPDMVLSAFPAERQQELSGMKPEQVAAEFVQDTALSWAARHLSSAPTGEDAYVVEEEVIKVLARSLRATQMAERLAGKLAHFIKEYSLPQSTYEKIQQELQWVALPPDQKQAKLLKTSRFSRAEFRWLMDQIKELLAKGMAADATALANQYLLLLAEPAESIQAEDLSRLPELLRAMSGVRTGFATSTTEKLVEALQREEFQGFKHFQLVNSLATLSQGVAVYEEWDLVQIIGGALEQGRAKKPEQHVECCEKMLHTLLPAGPIERLIEVYLQKRDDAAFVRNAATLLRWIGAGGIEALFKRLEDEQQAAHRLALLRLLERTGAIGIEQARRRLGDPRWYVVRNACLALGQMKDPELLQQLTPVLMHGEERVQKAAVEVIIKSRASGRAQVLAAGLRFLQGEVLEQALEEVMYLKDAASLNDLEEFICRDAAGGKGSAIGKAIQAVAATGSEKGVETLGRVLADRRLPKLTRKLACDALKRTPLEAGRRLLAEFANCAGDDDPLAAEAGAAASR